MKQVRECTHQSSVPCTVWTDSKPHKVAVDIQIGKMELNADRSEPEGYDLICFDSFILHG